MDNYIPTNDISPAKNGYISSKLIILRFRLYRGIFIFYSFAFDIPFWAILLRTWASDNCNLKETNGSSRKIMYVKERKNTVLWFLIKKKLTSDPPKIHTWSWNSLFLLLFHANFYWSQMRNDMLYKRSLFCKINKIS